MKFIEKLLPRYAWRNYLLVFIYNFLVFYGTRIYNTGFRHFNMETAADRLIPFWQPAIVIYILAFVQWILCFAIAMRESTQLCSRLTAAMLIAETMALVCFTVIPTAIPRPEVHGTGIFAWITGIVFGADSPDNLFPSIHCIFSWLCFRSAVKCKNVSKFYKIFTFVFTLLVMASTVLVKQHYVVDIAGGVVAAEAGWFASGFLKKACDE